MKKVLLIVIWQFFVVSLGAQTVGEKLKTIFQEFESDSQLRHAISSLYIINAKTGELIFDKNSQIGLAPASTQKIITSVTAYELLGKDFRYKTELFYDGQINNGTLNGNIYLYGTGDPTLGSWRYTSTTEKKLLEDLEQALLKKGIKKIAGTILTETPGWENQAIPDGWMWQDIGNYYGAGAYGINWRENQFDIILRSGNKIGDTVKIVKTEPELYKTKFISGLTSGEKNSGDNAYIYLPINSNEGYLRGTIPVEEKAFTISGSISNPEQQFLFSFRKKLAEKVSKKTNVVFSRMLISKKKVSSHPVNIYTHFSPTLDSIIYWLNKKSINLYAEALIKTFSFQKGIARMDSGIAIIKSFWKQKGLDQAELNIMDGSGLSPSNRVTTHAEVEVLKYAREQSWFSSFYYSLPEYNGMKMKSGTIGDVKGFAGYQTSKDGTEYIFSFLVNNYNGQPSVVVRKMYKVLDLLK